MPRLLTDALVIGSGAGGGPLALTFAQAGLDVLVLEKGPLFRRGTTAARTSSICAGGPTSPAWTRTLIRS